eukprot:scaffold2663_cov156-Skeletonema_marinoi.AAC.5
MPINVEGSVGTSTPSCLHINFATCPVSRRPDVQMIAHHVTLRAVTLSRGSDCDAVWFCPRRMKTPIVGTIGDALSNRGITNNTATTVILPCHCQCPNLQRLDHNTLVLTCPVRIIYTSSCRPIQLSGYTYTQGSSAITITIRIRKPEPPTPTPTPTTTPSAL